jgi:type VI secretion system protein ImpG
MKLDEDLLHYYTEELAYLRSAGREYARKYPKIADRLELHDGYPADPHVERLIESFALLTARIQHEMDAEFPEITSSLLGALYPQMSQPVPPMAIARFEIDARRGKFSTGHTIPKDTPLFAYGSRGATCRFRTSYPVTVWPADIAEASVEPPARYDFLAAFPKAAGVIRIRVRALRGSLRDLELNALRIYLNHRAGPAHLVYELFFSSLTGIMILPQSAAAPVALPTSALTPAGLTDEEDVLPYPPNAHPGYRLIQEYFQFPEKFLFVDLKDLSRHDSDQYFDVLFLLARSPGERVSVNKETFLLGCTPKLIPDARREHTTEIHSIQTVSSSMNPNDPTRAYEPFYSFHHTDGGANPQTFWHGKRVPTGREDMPGTDVLLSFLDLNFNPALPPSEVVFAHTLCLNRELATEVPPGGVLQMEEVGPVTVKCLTRPTAPVYPPQGGTTAWQLISNLSLNHLSLTSGKDGRYALCEILRLYCFSDQPSIQQQIRGIRSLRSRPTTLRIGSDAWRGFCAGTEVELTFDENMYAGGGAFLFATVLRHFLALYASVNASVQLVARRLNHEEEWMRWPPLAGRQNLI